MVADDTQATLHTSIAARIRMMRHRMTTPVLVRTLVALSFAMFLSPAMAGAQFSSQDCLDCHADADIMEGMEHLVVQEEALDESVHAFFECTDCHEVDDVPHEEQLGTPACGTCHDMSQEDYVASVHGQAAADGVEEAPRCGDCHGGHAIQYVDDPSSSVAPRNQPETCGTCHSDPAIVRKFYISMANPSEGYKRSAHYDALMRDGDGAPDQEPPTCSTCHSGHLTLRASDPGSTVYNGKVEELCGECHEATHDIYVESIHGRAHRAGHLTAPTCVSCHGEHSIVAPGSEPSSDELIRLSSETCVGCHEDQDIIQQNGFSALRVSSYRESYHGLAGKTGSTAIAWCASCHGTHNIYRRDDPRSLVNEDNLTLTCGRCHEGVTAQFAAIRAHSLVTTETTTPAGLVRIGYILLIVAVIGGMLAHNFIIYSRYLREKYRAERRLRGIRRFDGFQLIQHAILIVSFTILALTGFGLKFSDSFWVGWLQSAGLDESMRRWTHRAAAIAMIAQSAVQLVWFIASRNGRREIMTLIPTYQDAVDLVRNLQYHLFKTDRQPRYHRFDYAEKAEYLALIWGTAVMAITGLMLWVPEVFTRFWPAWTIEVATVIHYYEAILATAAIVVWHWFFVIYHPREFPMRLTWLTGTMTEHDYRHHHELEYDEVKSDPDRVVQPHHEESDSPSDGS